MNNNTRDNYILAKIIQYCDEIADAKEKFGNLYESLTENIHYKNSAAMCILQIGELTSHLSEEFRAMHKEIPWREIKNVRNIAAHNYGEFSIRALWDTIDTDIPDLRKYCQGIILS